MSRRLVAWVVVRGPLGRAFTDPSLLGPGQATADDLIDAVMIPNLRRREQQAVAQRPAGGAPETSSAPPAGTSTGLRGQAARDAIAAAVNEQRHRQRAARGRYTRQADRQAGASYRAGGNRRGGR